MASELSVVTTEGKCQGGSRGKAICAEANAKHRPSIEGGRGTSTRGYDNSM